MKRLLLLLAALIMILSVSVAFAEEDAPDSRVAKKNNVYETAEQIFAISWMPKDTEISVLDDGIGLWNIQAMDGDDNIAYKLSNQIWSHNKNYVWQCNLSKNSKCIGAIYFSCLI